MQTTSIIGLDIAKSVFQLHRVQVLHPTTAPTDRPALMDFWGRISGRSVVLPYVFASSRR
jgi:hypothetical protein